MTLGSEKITKTINEDGDYIVDFYNNDLDINEGKTVGVNEYKGVVELLWEVLVELFLLRIQSIRFTLELYTVIVLITQRAQQIFERLAHKRFRLLT